MQWLDEILFLLIAALVVWGLWRVSRPKRLFVVRIADGKPGATTGTMTPALLDFVGEIAAEHDIATGEVRGVAQGNLIRLEFSREFPKEARQQLRNWWSISGWPAGRSRT
jgi:hypothetical protein